MRGERALLVTGELFAPVLAEVAARCNSLAGTRLIVLPVKNRRFGDTVTVAGLLTVQDIIEQIKEKSTEPGKVILPRVVFDHPQALSLDDCTPVDIARALKATVCLADSMADVVRALAGDDAPMCVHAKDRTLSRTFLRAGGWSR